MWMYAVVIGAAARVAVMHVPVFAWLAAGDEASPPSPAVVETAERADPGERVAPAVRTLGQLDLFRRGWVGDTDPQAGATG